MSNGTEANVISSNPSTLSYPRTGKRGVPQQFARRLYEMLQSEAKIALVSPDQNVFISWSESGLAFRIIDIDGFTKNCLGRYFRTTKFSSFQRNLNLYGFAKVRKGPDTDMYAHPSFIRDRPELLFYLRKCQTASRRKMSAAAVISDGSSSDSSSSGTDERKASNTTLRRTVAEPSISKMIALSDALPSSEKRKNQTWWSCHNQPLIPKSTYIEKASDPTVGRLDLLALAVEHATF